MSNPADVIAKHRMEYLGKLYSREQQIERLPGMQEIKGKKKQFLKQFFFNAMHGVYEPILDEQLKEIEKQEAALLGSLQAYSGCAQCGGTGILNGAYCSCLRDRIYREAYRAADIRDLAESFENSDKSLFSETFRCVNGATQREKYAALENYAKGYAENYPSTKKPNLFLTGNTGLGKTYVLRSIAKLVHQKGGDVLLIGASNLFSIFYQHRMGEEFDLKVLWDCGLLLIDDLGIEPITHNVTVEYFLDLLNRRIDNGKHTVIASNLSTDNIVARYGERVYSRIRFKEICDQLVFEGQDIRLK